MSHQFATRLAARHWVSRLISRHLTERQRIWLAKTMAAAGGWFWIHVKLYRRGYTMDKDDTTGEFTFTPAGRHWSGPHWASRLGTVWPMAIDPDHYAHWAYMHYRCSASCAVCGGMTCSGDGCGWPPEVVLRPVDQQTASLRFGSRRKKK